MLLDPPGPRGKPQGMPHWPYVKAVDDALTARGIPPGTVRASHHGLERGLTTYMTLAWDVSRTSGRGGIRLDWRNARAGTTPSPASTPMTCCSTPRSRSCAPPWRPPRRSPMLLRNWCAGGGCPTTSSGRSGPVPGRYGLPPTTSAAPASGSAPLWEGGTDSTTKCPPVGTPFVEDKTTTRHRRSALGHPARTGPAGRGPSAACGPCGRDVS